jgi:hypothetical protein
MENVLLLPPAQCLLPSAYCLLPTDFPLSRPTLILESLVFR